MKNPQFVQTEQNRADRPNRDLFLASVIKCMMFGAFLGLLSSGEVLGAIIGAVIGFAVAAYDTLFKRR